MKNRKRKEKRGNHDMEDIVYFLLAMTAMIFGMISGIRHWTKMEKENSKTTEGKQFYFPTKANANPIPTNPCFYNIGSTIYHQSRECSGFSLFDTWDAITTDEAIKKGFTVCPLCREPIVFIYPRGTVYHKTKFCSDSQSIPYQVSEKEAIAKGLHPCRKCW